MPEGVEFLLDLQAKMDAATKMVREMTKVEVEALKAAEAIRKAEKSTTLLNDVMGKTGASFKAVGSVMVGQLAAMATFEGLKTMASGFVHLTEEALQAAGEAERTRRSFEGLMGVEVADELLGFMDRLANKTEFTDGALKGFASSLVRAGYSGEEFKRAIAATIDLAAMSQDKMAGAAEAINLLSKIQLKGGISERELVGARIDPGAYFKRIAETTGIGIKEVEKKIQEGKVSVGILREALYAEITKKTGKGLGGLGVSMSDTYLAQVEKAKDIIPNLFEELEKTGGLEKISAGLGRLVEGLAPDSPAGKRIIDGLTDMINRFGDLVEKVDFEVWSNRIVNAIELFTGVVDVGANVAGELGMLFDKFTMFGEALGESLYETVEFIGKFFDAAWEIGTAVWRGIKAGIGAGFNYVTEGISNLGDAISAKFKSVLGIHSPSAVFADFGIMIPAGVGVGIKRELPALKALVASALGPDALLPMLVEPEPVLSLASYGPAPTVPPGAAGGDRHFEANITVNVSGADSQGSPREVGETIAVRIRQEVLSLFGQLAVEGGAA